MPDLEVDVLGLFIFVADDIYQSASLDKETVDSFLTAFSVSAGSNQEFIVLEDFNNTNAFPIISTKEFFICFQYYALVEAVYDTPFFWMIRDHTYKNRAAKHRGEYLEGFAESKLGEVFGSNRVYKGIRIFRGKIEVGEVDCLVIYGDRAIVVQAKAKRLTVAARKGNDLQLRSDFKSAIQDAANQAALCIKAIASTDCRLVDRDDKEISIRDTILEAFPVALISDNYPALSFQCHSFLEFKTNEVMRQIFVMDVFTLDVIAEMLRSPLRFLSYMQLRAKAGRNLFATHELTVLAFHLRKNLWLEDCDLLQLADDISAPLDVAMAARRDGVPGRATPDGILTRLEGTRIGAIIASIDQDAEGGLIEFGLMLLRLNIKSAVYINDMIDSLIKKTTLFTSHDATIWTQEDGSGVTVHCNNTPLQAAQFDLRKHCTLRKYAQKARLWFGILVNPVSGDVRSGLTLNAPWIQNDILDRETNSMLPPVPLKGLRQKIGQKRKTGRNERCFCGSGLKFKKCCGKSR